MAGVTPSLFQAAAIAKDRNVLVAATSARALSARQSIDRVVQAFFLWCLPGTHAHKTQGCVEGRPGRRRREHTNNEEAPLCVSLRLRRMAFYGSQRN